MRSILVALALAAPVSAVAATNYTNPLNATRVQRPQTVMITLDTRTGVEREVRVGNELIKLHPMGRTNISVPVGTTILLYSNQDSRLQGVPLLQVAASDADRVLEVK